MRYPVLDKAPSQLQEAIDQGWAYKANTVEESEKISGLSNLAETVKNYNKLCATGKDTEFGNNKPIPGLFVAGSDEGSMYTTPYYDNEGSSFGLSLGSGVYAAETIRQYIKK